MALIQSSIHRYPNIKPIISMLDPMEDVTNLVDSLTASDYLQEVLIVEHHFSSKEAKARSKLIVPYVKIALSYLQQAEAGPPDVSFLPLYYALLNLSKVYILIGPHFADLPNNRWHGATYPVGGKDSQSILTEYIEIHKGGAIPLLYKTITGNTFPIMSKKRKRKVLLSEIYPLIPDISVEYNLASHKPSNLIGFQISYDQYQPGRFASVIRFPTITDQPSNMQRPPTINKFPNVFLELEPHPNPSLSNTFLLPFSDPPESNIRKYLFYQSPGQYLTPFTKSNMDLPEELPILLLFFHMSNVVRYKPEYFERLRSSKYWPMLSAARRHSILKALMLFWSFAHNTTLFINHE